MTPVVEAEGAALYHAPWQDLISVVPRCDLVCVDAPYSEKTHKGHDQALHKPEHMAKYAGRGSDNKDRRYAAKKAAMGTTHRREIQYGHWTADDVREFVEKVHPVCDGWIVSITDDVLVLV